MRRAAVALLFCICIVFMSGCTDTGKAFGETFGVQLPNRTSDFSNDNSGADADWIEVFNLSDKEFELVRADIAKNNHWLKFDKKSYEKIIGPSSSDESSYLECRRVGYRNDTKKEVIKPFKYENSYYCVYDLRREKLNDMASIGHDWNLEFVVLDVEHKVIYVTQQSV